MTQAPSELNVMKGFEPPRNIQFSVFLDNRVGRLFDLVAVFQGQALTLAGFSIHDSAEYAVIRILTSNSALARRLLERNKISFSETSILSIELSHTNTLANVCREFRAAELNIYYAYPLLVRPRGYPAIAMYTDDILLSAQILRRKLFTLLAENDYGENAPGSAPEMN